MESHENKLSHDEVIGIITMEDVMEELLQVKLLVSWNQWKVTKNFLNEWNVEFYILLTTV